MRAKGRTYDVSTEGIALLAAGHVLGMKIQWDDILYIKNVEGSKTFRINYYGVNTNYKSVKDFARRSIRRINKSYELKCSAEHLDTVKKLCKQCMPGVRYEQRKRTFFESQFLFLILALLLLVAGLAAFVILENILFLALAGGIALVANIIGFILTDKSKMMNVYRPGSKPQRYQSPFN